MSQDQCQANSHFCFEILWVETPRQSLQPASVHLFRTQFSQPHSHACRRSSVLCTLAAVAHQHSKALCFGETLSTLKFAARAKHIRCTVLISVQKIWNCIKLWHCLLYPVFVWGLPITVFESRKENCGPAIWGSDEWGIFRHGGISHAGGKAVSTLASTQMLMSLNVNLVSAVCYTSFWFSWVHEGEKPATAIGLAFKFPSYLFQISAAGATVRRSLHRQMRREEKTIQTKRAFWR